MKKLSDLSPEQRRIMLAEAAGWKFEPMAGPLEAPWRKPSVPAWDGDRWSGRAKEPPPYDTDLNAVADLEAGLTDEQWNCYSIELECLIFREMYKDTWSVLPKRYLIHAKPHQRASALLLTLVEGMEL